MTLGPHLIFGHLKLGKDLMLSYLSSMTTCLFGRKKMMGGVFSLPQKLALKKK